MNMHVYYMQLSPNIVNFEISLAPLRRLDYRGHIKSY